MRLVTGSAPLPIMNRLPNRQTLAAMAKTRVTSEFITGNAHASRLSNSISAESLRSLIARARRKVHERSNLAIDRNQRRIGGISSKYRAKHHLDVSAGNGTVGDLVGLAYIGRQRIRFRLNNSKQNIVVTLFEPTRLRAVAPSMSDLLSLGRDRSEGNRCVVPIFNCQIG